MPISNVSGSNFTTLYSSYQGNTNPYVPIPPSNANVSGQNYTTLYSAGSGTAPVPIATYGNANVESFLAVGSDTGGNVVGNILSTGLISATGNIITDQYFIGTLLGNITGNFVVPGLNTQVIYNNNGNAAASSGLTFVAASNTLTSGGVVSAVGNVRGGNLTTVGQVSATGNITTANYFLGNGAFLTGLPAGYSNANVSAYLASGTNTSNIITTANIAGTYFLGNGSQLTGLPATYSNANVTTLLANFGSNVISTTGNITAGYFIGNGSALTSITAANITGTVANATYALNANAATYATNAVQANVANVANSVAGANVSGTVANATYALNSNAATFAGTVTTAAQPNITSVGILTVINTSGAISATGNITGNVFIGNGSGLTNINAANIIGAYGNANVAANLAAFANNPISTSGNITAGYFIGNGAALTSLTGANVTGVVANATYALNANAATYATDAVQANYANIANSVAGANVSGTVANATYALTSNAATFAGTVTDAAQPNITSVGILTAINTSGAISATGNITGNVFIGNGAGLTNINAANIIGAYGNANVAANLAAFANNPISTSGNITAGYFIGNGSALSDIAGANVTGIVPLAQYVTQNAQANITSVGTLTSLSVSGNVTAGNVVTSGTGLLVGNVFSEVVAGTTAAVLTARMAADDTFRIAVGGATDDGFVELATADGGTEPILVRQYSDFFITPTRTLTLLDGSGNTSLPGNLSVVGNINGSNLNISNDALILGNLTVNGNTTFINSNVVTINDKFINLANNAANASAANGGGIGIGPIASEYATLTYDYLANVWTTNIGISVTGNITGNVFIGNGSGLTSLTGGNVTGTVANATYALNANAATFAGTVTTNAQPNITSVGILTAVNTSGDISATGNITGNVFSGNAAGLTNIPGGNVTGTVPLAQYVTQNAQANITSVGVLTALSVSGNITAGNITNNGTITSTGNITAPWFIGNVQGNIVGNVDAGGANTQVQFNDSDILNGTAGFTFDKTSNAVVITGNITSANVSTAGLITATGNVSGNNINAIANIGSSQQTIIGTANATASATGNIVVSGRNIATDVVFVPDASTTTTPTGGRVLIGAGIAGNTSIQAWDPSNVLRGPRVAIMDSYTKNNATVISGALTTYIAASLDGNITAGGSRVHGISSWVNVSGGAAGNTYLTSGGGAINNGLNALSGVLQLGGGNPNLVTQIGANITTRYATATSGVLQFNGNGTVVGNGYGHIVSMFNNATGNISIANVAAYGVGFVDLVTTTANIGNVIGYLFPDTTSQLFGLQSLSQSFQRSGNIYAFMNAGNLAQVRLGSTREQHYYAFPVTPTTGNVTVDAANGKVQTLTLTGNVAVIDFTNFITSAYNFGQALNIPQQDDVTLIIQQPASGPTYTVTLPTTTATGSYPVQYQNGVTAVNQDNLGRTYVNIRSQPQNMGGYPYYVAIESTAGSLPAAGSNTLVQFNDDNVLGAVQGFSYSKNTAILAAGNILAYNGAANVWGNINAANYFTQAGGQVNAANISGTTQIETPQLYANAITDGGFLGTGNIAVSAGNVNVTGNIFVNKNFYANIIDAGTYVSTPSLFTSDLTPPGGGPLNTTTTLSTINGNLSVTGTITGTGNITGGNLRTGGSVSATGNVISGNVNTGIVSATGNVIGGNLTTTGTSILGSIRSYSQSQYSLGTSGTINIDKTNGQVQYLAPTGNVTIGSLQNFITTASTGNQADTVTLVIKQGATPYTVTMPTGNAAIKYASGITSVGTTANSVTMISITGANVASAAMYMLTISPEFS